MADSKICRVDEIPPYYHNVTFIVNETGDKLIRSFDSPYLANKFANKLKYSKRCTLVSRPLY